MNRKQFAIALAAQAGITQKAAERVLDSMTEIVTETLANSGCIEIYGFGKFEVEHIPEHLGSCEKTARRRVIPAQFIPVWVPQPKLARQVQERNAQQ